jgi:hypothetical protein
MTASQFLIIQSDGITAESFDSREELALDLLTRLLEDEEVHVSAACDDDDSLIVEVM